MSKQKHISIRMDAVVLSKFYYVAKYYGRSGSGQISYMMRSLIDEFEKENGVITEKELKEAGLDNN